MNVFRSLKIFNESTQLLEYNRKDLRKWAGDDLTNRYMAIRGRLQEPENDLGYWIKKGNLEEFTDFIVGWETGTIKSKTQKKKEERIDGATKILDEAGWKVYKVTKYEAAKQLGTGTTWCICGKYHGAEERGKYYFDSYIKDYNLDGGYYFIFDTLATDPKSNDYLKYCAGVSAGLNLVFLYNGMQDHNITRKGIPIEDPSRAIELIKGVKIPFKQKYTIKNDILVKVDDENVRGDVTLPDGIAGIKHRCFKGNNYIYSINFPDSLKTIGSGAFLGSDLIRANLNKVESLGRGVFFNCGNLTQINLGTELKEIPDNTFGYCTRLIKIEIGDSVEKISDNAFDGANINLVFYTNNQVAIDYAIAHGFQLYEKNKQPSEEEVEIDG